MAKAIEGVEGEWRGKDGFSCIFYTLRQSRDEFHNMCAVEGTWGDEVGDGESV